jgi:hypothetical protein
MYTPGHTDDSYSYLMADRVFTGDTLLIRGTGRTDFQNGSARAQYDSIFGRLLKLPDETMVFPAHDYKGDTVSTIGEEKRFNPRLQVRSVAALLFWHSHGQSAGGKAARLTRNCDMVLTDCDGSSSGDQKGMRCGENVPNAAAAPATVSGESFVTCHWESRSWEGGEG